ncbi:MAG: hypothetical protein AAGD43_26175, partial [Pseudomonadota bacterium]
AMSELKRAVRSSRNPTHRDERQQSAMGQIGGMIEDEPSVEELIDVMLKSAADIAHQLPSVASKEKTRVSAA